MAVRVDEFGMVHTDELQDLYTIEHPFPVIRRSPASSSIFGHPTEPWSQQYKKKFFTAISKECYFPYLFVLCGRGTTTQ